MIKLEFRECLTKFEIFCAQVPELILNEVYNRNFEKFTKELQDLKKKSHEKFDKLDNERVKKN